MIKGLSISFLLAMCAGISTAQQLTPTVVSSSGGFYANQYGMLSVTTGELTAVETYINLYFILTQGFQQPWDVTTRVEDNQLEDFFFSVYPNPSSGNFHLRLTSQKKGYCHVQVIDPTGKQLTQSVFVHEGKTTDQSIDLSQMPQGVYLVLLTFNENTYSPNKHFVNKINIVK